jgi:predicted RNA-binding Zn ribbon-like protein
MSAHDPQFVFDLSGGQLALDFANTVSYRFEKGIERLPNFRELVRFGTSTGVIPANAMTRLNVKGAQSPELAERALREAIQLRETLFTIFQAIAEGSEVPAKALTMLNLAVQSCANHGRLVEAGERFEWRWDGMDVYLDSVLWPVTRAAVDLLLSEDLKNLRICASEKCGWLFLDKTKNHRRRWCDMKTCGNRVKARRHYARAKLAK